MRTLKVAIPAVVLGAGLLVCVTTSYGTPAYAKKEGNKPCTTCHAKMEGKDAMAKNLNAVGKYYHEKKTLEGAPTEKK